MARDKKEKEFVIVDIETTGGSPKFDQIIEIAAARIVRGQIYDTFHSLINPQVSIPAFITRITGITQDMVQYAPRFHEVAKDFIQFTEDAVFVAHNAKFDYHFIRNAYENLGYTYTRKMLCTVQLSRKAFPGLPSYSLGNLIRHFNIEVDARHRALDDVKATAWIFQKIWQLESDTGSNYLGLESTRKSLPFAQFSLERIMELPAQCGVYYLHNVHGEIIYVGKSKNIQKRILQHMNDTSEKGRKLYEQVQNISTTVTGSELIALIKEAVDIKLHFPRINHMMRRVSFPYVILAELNEAGFFQLQIQHTNQHFTGLKKFTSRQSAQQMLHMLIQTYELCNILGGVETGKSACILHHVGKCKGACTGKESVESYNMRLEEALSHLKYQLGEDRILIDTGRHPDELAVVHIENNSVVAFGFVDREICNNPSNTIQQLTKIQTDQDINLLVVQYLTKRKLREEPIWVNI